MIRVPEDKTILIDVPYTMFEETGLLVGDDELETLVNEEQYNRLKASYDSKKFKNMNEDESLADLCMLFEKEVRVAKWQRFVFNYPEDIIYGITFEEETRAQWDAEAFNAMVEAISADLFDPEDEAEIEEVAAEAYAEGERSYELRDDMNELNKWMKKKGFENGQTFYCWFDENNHTDGTFDIAWPNGVYGLQRGFTKPVALRIDATDEEVKAAEDFGFTLLTSIDEFKAFIEKNYK